MLRKRFWTNFVLLFVCSIICLSLWQMAVNYPEPAVYTLNTVNSSYVYPVEYLPSSDYTTLMNLGDFKFDLLNECSHSPILLVLVHTAPENYALRKSIRETWGGKRKHLEVVFILGNVVNVKLQNQLEVENEEYRDLVQGRFLDAYRNMTYKHVTAFKFAIYHCPEAKYVLKSDDDVFINMPTMMDFLTVELSPYGARKLISCVPIRNAKVKRSFRSKWRVSVQEYGERYYPPYCSGWATLYSPDVLFTLYQDAQKSKYFWIDDVLITGTLVKKENIQHTNVQTLVLTRQNVRAIVAQKRSFVNSKIFLYAPPHLKAQQLYPLWDFVNNRTNNKSVLKDKR